MLGKLLLVLASVMIPWLTLILTNHTSILNRWDDWRWLTNTASPQGSILIIDIDEKSLAQHGRWPWSRHKLATLFESLLNKHQAAIVGVDIILADHQEDNSGNYLSQLDSERIVWAHAASLGGEPPVSQGVLSPAPTCPEGAPWGNNVNGWLGLSPDIAPETFRAGHIRPWPDGDQIVRVYMPFLSDGRHCIPALGLAMYGAIMGLPSAAELKANDTGWSWGGIPLGLEPSGLLRIKWQFGSIRTLSAADVLAGNGTIPANAMILVGSTAVGIGDFVHVPGIERFAGVGVHALALRQWLDRDFIAKPPEHDLLVYALLAVTFWVLWWSSSKATLKLWLSGLAIFVAANGLAYALWLKDIYLETEPMLWAMFWMPGIQGYRLWQEKRARNIIYNQFHAYLPERVLKELIDSQVDPSELAAQSREVSVLFADIQGFTTISENMDPVEAVRLLNEVMDYLSRHIAAHDGTLDKFMGDCVMAFWGAPIEVNNHADSAIDCALAILNNLDQLNDKLSAAGLPAISLGIGINSGQVAVGNMGSLTRKNYTVVGDVVNIASRLQQLCSTLKFNLLIGGDTAVRSEQHALHKIRDLEVKGKKRQVSIYCHKLYWSAQSDSALESNHD